MEHENTALRDTGDLHVCAFDLRTVQNDAREAEFVASSDAIDSYGERVEQSWDLGRFTRNPVILWAHQSRELPIGQAVSTRMVEGRLHARIRFASEKANPLAERVWQSVQEGTLRAVSVGFVPRDVRTEKSDGREVVVLSDNELYEISVTPIPANPEALMRARKRALATQKTSAVNESATEAMMSEDRIKALEATVLQREAEVRAAEKRASDAETNSKALESQNARLVAERDAALAAQKTAERKLVDAEVSALVGVKFSKDEVADQIELALTNRPLFERLAAQRAPLPAARDLTGAGPVINPEPEAAAVRAPAGDDGALVAEAMRLSHSLTSA